MITEIEDYFAKGCGRCERFSTADCSTRHWEAGLAALRQICLDVGLVETVKWGHPCYLHAERNIAILGAHRGDFRLCFFNASLMKDPKGILEKQGPNTRHPDMVSFSDPRQVSGLADTLRAYLREAMGYAAAGTQPIKEVETLALPDELTRALEADPELDAAFHALTPGRKRSYVINLRSAKKSETRVARIEKFRAKILAGKGAMDR